MKIIIDDGCVKDNGGDATQMKVQRVAHRIGGLFADQIEMANLGQGVNTGIRPSRAQDPRGFPTERCDRFLQRLLHAKAIILALPANEARAIVFDCQFITGHMCVVIISVAERGLVINDFFPLLNSLLCNTADGKIKIAGHMSTIVDIDDGDRDALHILPLAMLPFQTAGLKRARMVKNVRLESVIELFSEEGTGSGQMDIRNIGSIFGWPEDEIHPDLTLLRKLATLPSFDVYSLRIALRKFGIDVENQEALKLSPAKTRDLTAYMTGFTHALLTEVYGSTDLNIENFDDIIALFRDPDVKKAREQLDVMAKKLGIGLGDIPAFLEDYGDIFLSLSYYRQSLDDIEPVIEEFLGSMDEIRGNWQLKQDQNLMRTCDMLQSTVNELMAQITGRFENFEQGTQDLWSNISAKRFQRVKALIESYHTTIGGVLCALSVKIDAWHHLFPSHDSGGPLKRAEFILSEMKQGIENIQKIESSAPMLSGLDDDDDDDNWEV